MTLKYWNLFLFPFCIISCVENEKPTAEKTEISDDIVLPIEDFSVRLVQDWFEIKWETLDELGLTGFGIERSEDKVNYEEIKYEHVFGSVTGANYLFIDDFEVLNHTYYYRLKFIYEDGRFNYSTVYKATSPKYVKSFFKAKSLKTQNTIG